MGYSADKSPLIGHLAGPLRRLEPLVAQRQEKCGPNRPTPTGYSCNNAVRKGRAKNYAFDHRVYSGQELRMLMEGAGFVDVRLCGSLRSW